MSNFSNVSEVGDGCEIPSFNGSEKAKVRVLRVGDDIIVD